MNNNPKSLVIERTTTMPPAPDYELSGQKIDEEIASISKSQNPTTLKQIGFSATLLNS